MPRKTKWKSDLKPRVITLMNVSQYAKHWGINRATVYNLLRLGKLTKYVSPKGKSFLDPLEMPRGVRRYKGPERGGRVRKY